MRLWECWRVGGRSLVGRHARSRAAEGITGGSAAAGCYHGPTRGCRSGAAGAVSWKRGAISFSEPAKLAAQPSTHTTKWRREQRAPSLRPGEARQAGVGRPSKGGRSADRQ